ncbi:MAG TPA: type VI secretion system protein TssA [Duganella sp.]
MNQTATLPDTSAHVLDAEGVETLFERLLAPLDGALPCGPPARYDAAVTEIRLLREEDDLSLPMGQWERPLKRADWAAIERQCVALLCGRSKDLQTVVWLVEAWMRLRGFGGLGEGLRLLDALLHRYWQGLYPLIDDDGDCDARLAPLEWLNETLSTAIQLHATLLTVDDCRPPQVSLADWERLAVEEMAAGAQPQRRDGEALPTRADLIAAASPMAAQVAATRAAVQNSLDHVDSIVGFLQECLREQAPQLAKLRTVLEAADRVLLQIQASQLAAQPPALAGMAAVGAEHFGGDAITGEGCADKEGADEAALAAALASPVAVLACCWRDRNEAYATLEALADYLVGLEPHSPTPFLLRRAVRWGNMPLPEVLAEILREEGDLNRLVNVLGLRM